MARSFLFLLSVWRRFCIGFLPDYNCVYLIELQLHCTWMNLFETHFFINENWFFFYISPLLAFFFYYYIDPVMPYTLKSFVFYIIGDSFVLWPKTPKSVFSWWQRLSIAPFLLTEACFSSLAQGYHFQYPLPKSLIIHSDFLFL